ncbi:retinol dehydrogenase 13 [Lucilia sericata]|uniref:retinol dehydrogenase 13 n=1 Tax=Lucilia sericata TaxID=13632 RepID=UPI0018A7EF65|nr:retinol dehydrogenase 13 [Lucilia sericata]
MDELKSLLENADPFQTWWPAIAALVVCIIVIIRTLMSGQRCPNDNQIKDQIVIITGGNTGIGYEIAKALAGRGGRIILACRNMQEGEKAARVIKRELGCTVIVPVRPKLPQDDNSVNTNTTTALATQTTKMNEKFFVEVRYLDLRSFDSVHRFARNITREFERVDILINNAGVIFAPAHITTIDGFEQHLQVNYLSHFLLSHLLLGHLRKSANGRIINVTAHAYAAGKMDFDDPLNVGTWSVQYHARDAFSHSKLAVLLATRWMARELKETSITVNCCTPGLVRGTSHLRNSPLMSSICVKLMTLPWMWLFMKNPYEGAQCAIRLATDPQLKQVTGEYFNDCEIAATIGLAQDKELAKKLYMQTIEVLKKVTKLEIDKAAIEEDDGHTTDTQDDEVEALQAEIAIKNKLQ